MNKNRIDKLLKYVLMFFLLIQPIFDFKFFYNSYSTLIRTVITIILFLIMFFKSKNKKKYNIYIYLIALMIYFIFHNFNALNFKSVVPGNFSYSTLGEALYFIKMLVPFMLIFILNESDVETKDINRIIKYLTIFIGGNIIITNLIGMSYGSYSDEIIKKNFISWFEPESKYYTYKDLSSKGWFEYANQIGAILIMFLPFNMLGALKNQKNKITCIINLMAIFLIGTRVAILGTIIVFAYVVVSRLFCIKYNKEETQKNNYIFMAILIVCYLIVLPKNPVFNRIDEMVNLKENTIQVANENIESENEENIEKANQSVYMGEQQENDKANEIELNVENEENIETEEKRKKDFIENNYKDKKILEQFIIKSYPYEYDPEFWINIMEKDIKIRTDYRYLEKEMIKRVVEYNNNQLDKYLGISYVRVQNIFNIEQDFIVHYYSIGIIGTIIIFAPYVFILINAMYELCKKIRLKEKINEEKIYAVLTIILMFIIAYHSGNLLNSLSFTMYFSLIYVKIISNKKKEEKMFIKNIWLSLKKYKFLLNQLISRDFKVKYKRSILGVVWSLLYPILTMTVMALVFSNIFKFSTPGVNYLVYLLTGLVMFNYFNEASNLAMSSVVANFALINKIYIPKYIFPISKCLFVGINFLLTLIPLYAIILITGTPLNVYHLLLPYAFLCLFIFTVGMGLLLSAVSVFLRDMFYIYGIVMTLWMYITPIMYDIKMIDEQFQFYFKLNPLYHYINFARRIILYNEIPTPFTWLVCAGTSILTLLIGVIVFKKNQDKFIYYI